MEKTLSLIIPTYNMEKYLGRCLDSLLSGTSLEKLEVLVINDGSKDASLDIARGYEKKYPGTIRVIDKPNGNYGSCINRGLKEATGKYIKILDADDWFDTSALDEFLLTLGNLDVDLVVSDYMYVSADGSERRRSYKLTPGTVLPLSACSDVATVGMFEMHAIAYRRENLVKMGYVQSEGISYTDLEWATIPMATVGTLYYYNKPVYYYFIGRDGNTMSMLYTPRWLSQALIVRKAIVDAFVSADLHDDVKRQYMFDIVLRRLYDMYAAALVKGGLDGEEMRAFDDMLMRADRRLYDALATFNVHRYLPYKFVSDWRRRGHVSPLVLMVYRHVLKIKN